MMQTGFLFPTPEIVPPWTKAGNILWQSAKKLSIGIPESMTAKKILM